jgi:F0F1-type ATP synthase assembly protein I
MDHSVVQALAIASQLGFVVGAAVLLGYLAGSFLDARFGTSPVFLVLGILIGVASGFYSVAQLAKFLLARFGRSKTKDEGRRTEAEK